VTAPVLTVGRPTGGGASAPLRNKMSTGGGPSELAPTRFQAPSIESSSSPAPKITFGD